MKTAIRIILADDATMFVEGFELLLKKFRQIRLIGIAPNGHELLKMTKELQPDVVVTDIKMPGLNGIEATEQLLEAQSDLPIIGITQFEEEDLIVSMLEAGARGYLLKASRTEELVEAIETVYAGGTYYCNGTSLRLVRKIAGSSLNAHPRQPAVHLTEKEVEIIRLICQGYSTKEIPPLIHLSETTVETYRIRIKEKLGCKNWAELAVYAIRNGIIKI